MIVDGQSSLTMDQFRRKARMMKKKGATSIFIDQFNKLKYSNKYMKILDNATECALALKVISSELEIPIFNLTQINRDADKNKDGRPSMSNLKNTGALEEESDCILLRNYHPSEKQARAGW
jgi:replicative DNA helicase